jgi:hypothetical protein
MKETGSGWPAPVRCQPCRSRRKARHLAQHGPRSADWRRDELRVACKCLRT